MSKKVNYLFSIISFVAVLPFLVLAFFARPAADDLTANFYTNRYGIWEMSRLTYLHLSGRFFSMPLFLSIASYRETFSNYYLVPIGLMFLFVTAACCAIKSINRYYLKIKMPGVVCAGYGVFLLLLYFAVITDVASSFFWMAAGVVYQLPLILFLFFISNSIEYFNTGKRRYQVISAVLVFCLFGCNEVIVFLLLPLLGLFTFLSYAGVYKYRHFSLFILLIAGISAAILLLSPGANSRSVGMAGAPGILYTASAALLQFFIILMAAFSTPVFWGALLALVLNLPLHSLEISKLKEIKIVGYAILCFNFLAYLIVFAFKDNGLPGRANNVVSFFFLLAALLFAIVAAVKLKEKLGAVPGLVFRRASFALLMITVFTNSNYKNALKDVLSGYAFSQVYDKRVNIVRKAVNEGKHGVQVNDYNFYWNEVVNSKIPGAFNKPFRKLVPLYPGSIFFCDDLAEKDWDNGFAEYYNIDTIYINNKVVLRHSIVKGLQKKN